MWVLFEDKYMHGARQTDYDFILIQGTKEEALNKFQEKFGFDPLEITCDICESHFSTENGNTMEEATGYIRHCKFDQTISSYVEEARDSLSEGDIFDYLTLEEFLVLRNVLVLE